MTEELNKKYEALQTYFRQLGSVAIAFSSGVDSTFMLKVAHDVLGDKAVAVTARSHSFPCFRLCFDCCSDYSLSGHPVPTAGLR